MVETSEWNPISRPASGDGLDDKLKHTASWSEWKAWWSDAECSWIASSFLGNGTSHVCWIEFETTWTTDGITELLAIVADNELIAEFGWWCISSAAFQFSACVDVIANCIMFHHAHSLFCIKGCSWRAFTIHCDTIDTLPISGAVVWVSNLNGGEKSWEIFD